MPHQSNEQLRLVIDDHWIVTILPILFTLLLTGAGLLLLALAGWAEAQSMWLWPWFFLLGSTLLLIAVHWFFFFMIGRQLSRVLITDRRIIQFDDVLIFREDLLEISFERMKSVEARKHGVLQYALNYGSLLFEGGGKGRIDYVPHPGTAAREIVQAMGMK